MVGLLARFCRWQFAPAVWRPNGDAGRFQVAGGGFLADSGGLFNYAAAASLAARGL